jgi:hypothetical protein
MGLANLFAYKYLRHPVAKFGRGGARARLGAVLNSQSALIISGFIVIFVSAIAATALGARTSIAVGNGVSLVAIAALEFLRRRYNEIDNTIDPRFQFTRPALILYVLAMAIFMMSLALSNVQDARILFDMRYFWVAVVTLVLYGVLAIVFLLRSDWFRLSAGRDLSWLATAFVLPLIFELTNNALPRVFEAVGIFLPDASGVASVLVVVALLQPIQRGLESVFEAISSPAIHRVRRQLDDILGEGMENNDDAGLGNQIEAIFQRLGIQGYALWSRRGRCEFVPRIDRLSRAGSLILSDQLCHRIARTRSVIDLESVHSEWNYFFDQFELHRLAILTRGRYLYPVRVGRSLWGLLLLDDSPATRSIARNTFTETANDIGMALFRWKQ